MAAGKVNENKEKISWSDKREKINDFRSCKEGRWVSKWTFKAGQRKGKIHFYGRTGNDIEWRRENISGEKERITKSYKVWGVSKIH